MFPGVAEVGEMVTNRVEAVLVSRPGDSVGDSLPSVRVRAAPHVVASLRGVARVRDAVFTGGDAVRSFVPAKEGKADPLSQRIPARLHMVFLTQLRVRVLYACEHALGTQSGSS